MTVRAAADGFRKFYLSKSELILRGLPRHAEAQEFENTYKQYISKITGRRNMGYQGLENIVVFPLKTFKKFPKSTIEKWIKSSYNIIKSNKSINGVQIYNSILKSYLTHDIDCDVSNILSDINSTDASFDNNTFLILIELYSRRGDMGAVENLLSVMKTKQLTVTERCKLQTYGGYIRAGQLDKGAQFLAEENLAEDDVNVLIQKAKACADLGQVEGVLTALDRIKQIDNTIIRKLVGNIYMRLVNAKSSDDDLDHILADSIIDKRGVKNLIINMNRWGFYNHSLKLLLKFAEVLVGGNVLSDVVTSFNSVDCPANTYATVLKECLARIQPNAHLNLFSNMSFADTLLLCNRIILPSNAQIVVGNLLLHAVKGGSAVEIEESLETALQHMHHHQVSTAGQYVLLPAMIDAGMASRPQDILHILPQNRRILLPSVLLHHLCKGDLACYNQLLREEGPFVGSIDYHNYSRNNAKRILDNVPFKEADKVVLEAAQVFPARFVHWLLSSVVCERVIQMAESGNDAEIREAVAMAKEWDTSLDPRDIEYLRRHISPNSLELVKVLESRPAAVGDYQ